jgi:glutathione S-transferase
MSDEILFYSSPMSRGRMVHWMLEESGAPYRLQLVDLQKGQQREPSFLAVNPMGKLPAVVWQGTVITETAAIITWLADAFPAAGLAPRLDDPARGGFLRWMFFCASCFDAALMDRMLQRPPPEGGPRAAGALGYGSYERTVETVAQALQPGPWLLGKRFTAADLYLASQIGFGLFTKALEPKPIFLDYVARATARPGHERFKLKSDALAAGLKAAG